MTGDESLTGDNALAAAARAGDEKAFELLVQNNAEPVYRVIAGILGTSDHQAVEDAAQEAFVRVHQGLASFEGNSRLSTWIYRIATNVALTRVRSRRRGIRGRERALVADDAYHGPVDPGESVEEQLVANERREALLRAVAQLPEEQRAVVALRGFEGLPFEEVARTLGIPRPTAESRMARAKERLKGLLGSWLSNHETDVGEGSEKS